MTETDVGDIVFSFADTLIKTVGVVSSSARSAEKPKEFGKAGAGYLLGAVWGHHLNQ